MTIMAGTRERITSRDVPNLLDVLAGDDLDAKCNALTTLCPCRNRVYVRDAWLAILHAEEWGETEHVRDRARHALDSLRERVPFDSEAESLVRWLLPHDGRDRLQCNNLPAVTARNVEAIVEILAGDDAEAQCALLEALCPCRNRIYSRDIWRAIFAVRERTENPSVKDKAAHAIGTLRERVRTDPRSQELVRDLAGEIGAAGSLEAAIPVWNTGYPRKGAKLPSIPKFERGHRSRPNKQR
jgi:hypothetical protein